VGLTAVVFFLRRPRSRWDTGMGSIIASGAGFAASNVATKLLSDDIGSDTTGSLPRGPSSD